MLKNSILNLTFLGLLFTLSFCNPQLPYTKKFSYKGIKKYIIAYNKKYKGFSNAVELVVDSANNFYLAKPTYLGEILVCPPNEFSKIHGILVLLYDLRRNFLDSTNFNKHLIQKYSPYLQNDLHCDYKIAKEGYQIDNIKISKGDTLWMLGDYSTMRDYPYWKITKNGKTFLKEEIEYNKELIRIYNKIRVKKIKIYKYYTPRNRIIDDE